MADQEEVLFRGQLVALRPALPRYQAKTRGCVRTGKPAVCAQKLFLPVSEHTLPR